MQFSFNSTSAVSFGAGVLTCLRQTLPNKLRYVHLYRETTYQMDLSVLQMLKSI